MALQGLCLTCSEVTNPILVDWMQTSFYDQTHLFPDQWRVVFMQNYTRVFEGTYYDVWEIKL